MAVPFDLERLEVRGEAVPVVQGVLQFAAQYSLSATGSLAYVSGTPQARQSELVWVTRNGTEHPLGAPARSYNQPRLSPDGRRVAVDVIEKAQDMQVWLYDLTRDTFAPFTFQGLNRHAVWTPDGKRIAFMSNREGATQIFWQLANGSGGLQRLTTNSSDDNGRRSQHPLFLVSRWTIADLRASRPHEAGRILDATRGQSFGSL